MKKLFKLKYGITPSEAVSIFDMVFAAGGGKWDAYGKVKELISKRKGAEIVCWFRLREDMKLLGIAIE